MTTGVEVGDVVGVVLVVAYGAAGVALVRRDTTRRSGVLVLAGVLVAGLGIIATALLSGDRGPNGLLEGIESLAAVLVIAIAFHLLVTMPDGTLPDRSVRNATGAVYGTAVIVGVLRWTQQPTPPVWPVALFGSLAAVAGVVISNRRYVQSRGVARQRMQWLGLAVALCLEIALIVVALGVLIDWPPNRPAVIAASLVLVAGALAASSSPRLVGRVDRMLSHVVSFAGLSAVVTVIYLVIVVGLGRVPTDNDKVVLVLSMAAAAASALVYVPARAALNETANRLVYGDSREASQALDTFGSRLTRAVPMDELLLQLAEVCTTHLSLVDAEVWAGTDGRMSLAASVPDRSAPPIALGEAELPVVSRARVSGRGWAEVWLPELVEGRGDGPLRVVPMVHGGELFGLLVLERPVGDDDFSEDDDQVLAELARQVALALHTAGLDVALQETLREVQQKNVELQESRVRIVAAGDAERRKFERNLHDGAQQNLVALAVKLSLVERVSEKDPAAAKALLEEARADVFVTVEEVRALAHGLYPKVLTDLGLHKALGAAAGRGALPTSVVAEGIGRFNEDAEAAVYFCCLEAMQNAGKHAGEGASLTVEVGHDGTDLWFSVTDDGAGFDMSAEGRGHGFTNMDDRLGALGGSAEVRSAPGEGTTVSGRIPVEPLDDQVGEPR